MPLARMTSLGRCSRTNVDRTPGRTAAINVLSRQPYCLKRFLVTCNADDGDDGDYLQALVISILL